jgi:thiosulfate reductase cytochrome b subunit
MKRIWEKHPLVIRWCHWVNFPILALMTWSGILIYWANDVYRLHIGGWVLLPLFPEWFYNALDIPHHLAEGMAWHFMFMWLFAINGVLYVSYTIFSGEWRLLVPNRHSFRDAWQVVLHDLHIRRSKPPQLKYNAAQRIAYSAIILMGLGSLLTGAAIYKPVQLGWLCQLLGGYRMARAEHFVLTVGYVLFFLVHIIQVVLAGWNNFMSVIRGIEVLPPVAEAPKDETSAKQDTT